MSRISRISRTCGSQLVLAAVLMALSGLRAGQAATEVEVASLEVVAVYPVREASAAVHAQNESRISAQISAVLNRINVEVGESVPAGAVLAELDERDSRLALQQVEAQRNGLVARLKLAERQLARARELKSDNFITTEAVNQRSAEVVSLKAELRAAQARVAVAKRQLAKTAIKAPFDAVVVARTAQRGELTSPGTPLFTLVQRGGEELRADIPAELTASLGKAKPLLFVVQSSTFPVELIRISPVISRTTRSRLARLRFADNALPVGTDGRLRWTETVPHLPTNLIVRRDTGLGVFVMQDGKARFKLLPDAQEGRTARVDWPLDLPVVVRGQASLRDGDSVVPSQ